MPSLGGLVRSSLGCDQYTNEDHRFTTDDSVSFRKLSWPEETKRAITPPILQEPPLTTETLDLPARPALRARFREAWLSNPKADLLSGLVVALALIPEAISFSIIAGVDPKVGLYASFSIAIIISMVGGRSRNDLSGDRRDGAGRSCRWSRTTASSISSQRRCWLAHFRCYSATSESAT